MRQDDQTNDGETLALGALGWVLADDAPAEGLLALTGLTPETPGRACRSATSAVLRFLENHETWIACAGALAVPLALVAARQELEG